MDLAGSVVSGTIQAGQSLAGSGGGAAQNNSLEIHLNCSKTQKNLHNVAFHLYTLPAGRQVCMGSAVTSADGKLVFHGLTAASRRQYTLVQDTASLWDEHGKSYGWPMISIGGAAPVRLDETIAFSQLASQAAAAVAASPQMGDSAINKPIRQKASTRVDASVSPPAGRCRYRRGARRGPAWCGSF